MKRLSVIAYGLLCLVSLHAQETPIDRELIQAMPIFSEQLKATLTYPLAYGNSPLTDFTEWRNVAREKVLECMAPAPPRADFDAVVIDEEQRDGYKAQKVIFNVSAFSRIPAYLLIPDGDGPFPAVVMLHDHGGHFSIGKEKMIKPFGVSEEVLTDAEEWTYKCYDGVFVGDYFAKQGYVVFSIDALYWGDRGTKDKLKFDGQQALSANLLQMGMSWGALIIWDDLSSISFVNSLPNVKKNCIGVLGHSMGCYRAWMTAALSDEVKAGVNICWMCTTDSLMTVTNNQNKGTSAYAMLIPNLRNYLDYPDVATIACPKPMLFFNGLQDKLFPPNGVRDAYGRMRKVWQSQNADYNLVTELWESPHYFNKAMQQRALQFFNEKLK